jgi:hypothetical protein
VILCALLVVEWVRVGAEDGVARVVPLLWCLAGWMVVVMAVEGTEEQARRLEEVVWAGKTGLVMA